MGVARKTNLQFFCNLHKWKWMSLMSFSPPFWPIPSLFSLYTSLIPPSLHASLSVPLLLSFIPPPLSHFSSFLLLSTTSSLTLVEGLLSVLCRGGRLLLGLSVQPFLKPMGSRCGPSTLVTATIYGERGRENMRACVRVCVFKRVWERCESSSHHGLSFPSTRVQMCS